MPPDILAVRGFVSRVHRRLEWLSAAKGAAAGLGAAIALALVGWPGRDSVTRLVAVGLIATIMGILIRRFSATERTAIAIERRVPESRNLILTADELATRSVDGYAPSLVFGAAATLVRRLDPAALFPARNAGLALGGALTLWLLLVARPILPLPTALGGSGATATASGAPVLDEVSVTIEPPAYTGRAKQTLRDPARIEALAGSTIALSVRARAGQVSLETLASKDTLIRKGSSFVGTLTADADGYVAIQPSTGGRTGARRLIGVTVIPDAPPSVRIVAPGRDQRLPDGHRTLDIGIEAGDDIGLASLKLRFTKVSGSGERFTFVESDVPLTIARQTPQTWTARATWKLDSLNLEPGDMVVYRAIAADNRPAGGLAESDAYIAEVLAPGGVAAAGFALDPEEDRYAASQQMVILKTERLLAARPAISSDSFANATQQIAAEQRKVRAEFVFMLGGELADAPDLALSMTDIDETQEAEGEADILAGRNANAGHVALLRAIRAMSRAAASLTQTEPTTALPYERTALKNLESAFSRSRILLRALTTRERLDLSRRLTGTLTDAVRDVRPSTESEASARTVALRRVLADIAALSGTTHVSATSSTSASELAERVLHIDASSKPLQDASAQLSSAAAALAANHGDAARDALDRASVDIVGMLRGELLDAPAGAPRLNDARLNGALVDALRAAPGKPR